MQNLDRIFIRGIFGIVSLVLTNIFLFFYNIYIPINFLTLIFSFLVGFGGVVIIVIITMLS